MDNSASENALESAVKSFRNDYFILAASSLLALAATFLVAGANWSFAVKSGIFVFIVFLYFSISLTLYFRQSRQINSFNIKEEAQAAESIFGSEIEAKLLALEEAGTFFGASLKLTDMFRLVSSRLNEMIPFACAAFFLAADDNTTLKIVCADGKNAHNFVGFEIKSDKGLAGKTFINQKSQTDDNLLFDKNVLPTDALKDLNSGVCVPLRRGADVFGVLQLFGDAKRQFGENSLLLLEAIAERTSPLFLSSLAFERNLNNALTDSLTNLPNERAFFLVLENQIAESQRFQGDRPLTILTADIAKFTEFNQKFGHAAGDRILTFAAEVIKGQLRQMDFLARSTNDEFLAVLPTASDETTREIVERLTKAFAEQSFAASEKEKIHLRLNFGSASFGKDGETAEKLVQNAYLRKQQLKSRPAGKIIRFPNEYVN